MYPNYIGRRIMMCVFLMAAFAIIWDVLGGH